MGKFTTGDVAKQLHISIRTLRYYDQIDLVKPTIKEETGRRLYTDEDLFQLEKVCLLKKLKLPLKEIQQVLHHMTTKQVLEFHQQSLLQEIQELQSSLTETKQLQNSIEIEGDLNWELLLPLIRSDDSERKRKHWEGLFQEDELNLLGDTMPTMGDDSALTRKWIQIIKRIELCLDTKKSPQSKEAQLIAEDIHILSDEMFQGNRALEEKFWAARSSKETSNQLGLYPIDEDVLLFIEEAMDHLESLSTTINNSLQSKTHVTF